MNGWDKCSYPIGSCNQPLICRGSAESNDFETLVEPEACEWEGLESGPVGCVHRPALSVLVAQRKHVELISANSPVRLPAKP